MGKRKGTCAVPLMQRHYLPDKDLIGERVVLLRCEHHENPTTIRGYTREELQLTGNCNCELKGKSLTITGMKDTPGTDFYQRTRCYTVAESDHLIHEFEFAEDIGKPDVIVGYIVELEPGVYVSEWGNRLERKEITEAALHDIGIMKALAKSGLGYAVPTKAYPAEYDPKTERITLTGEPVPWEELCKKLLVKKANGSPLHKEVVTGIVQIMLFIEKELERRKEERVGFSISELYDVGAAGKSDEACVYLNEFAKDGVGGFNREQRKKIASGSYESVWEMVNTYLGQFGHGPTEPVPIQL